MCGAGGRSTSTSLVSVGLSFMAGGDVATPHMHDSVFQFPPSTLKIFFNLSKGVRLDRHVTSQQSRACKRTGEDEDDTQSRMHARTHAKKNTRAGSYRRSIYWIHGSLSFSSFFFLFKWVLMLI